jgi:hypothetical protein
LFECSHLTGGGGQRALDDRQNLADWQNPYQRKTAYALNGDSPLASGDTSLFPEASDVISAR